MKSQAERDQQTVTIATFLAIFVGILLAGGALGLVITIVYLVRHRHRHP